MPYCFHYGIRIRAQRRRAIGSPGVTLVSISSECWVHCTAHPPPSLFPSGGCQPPYSLLPQGTPAGPVVASLALSRPSIGHGMFEIPSLQGTMIVDSSIRGRGLTSFTYPSILHWHANTTATSHPFPHLPVDNTALTRVRLAGSSTQ